MRILVFAAKWVGLRCLTFLLDHYPDDEVTVVVCEPGAADIVAELERRRHPWHRLDDSALDMARRQPSQHYDWLLNLWGGHIFKDDILSRAKHSLNIHPSFLPYCRGRDPVVWAIRHELPAGVTLHAIEVGVDEGPIWYQEEISYSLPCTGASLYERVAERSWQCFVEQWPRLRSGECELVDQTAVSTFPTFRRQDLYLDRDVDADANQAARALLLRLMAHDFSPDYAAQVKLNGETFRATVTLTREEPGRMEARKVSGKRDERAPSGVTRPTTGKRHV